MPGLSKSKYTKFCLCDKALWLKTFKPDDTESLGGKLEKHYFCIGKQEKAESL